MAITMNDLEDQLWKIENRIDMIGFIDTSELVKEIRELKYRIGEMEEKVNRIYFFLEEKWSD